MLSTLIRVFLTITAFLSLGLSAFAGTPVQINPASIKEAVTRSDVLDKEYKQHIYTSFENGIASVSLFRHPEATRADCKIDTVLIARQIIALSPHEIKLVRCVFYDCDRQNQYWEVEVRAQLVTAFAQGKIGEQELINSVLLAEDRQKNPLSEKFAALSYSGILNENSVCKGACQDRRLAISLRLKELERQGVAPGHFREDFLRLEDAARRGRASDLFAQINSLTRALDEYEQQMISSGQLPKQELHHSRNALRSKTEAKAAPLSRL